MARPRKIIINRTVLFITTSLEEGILLTANPLMVAIILSALARAQFHHNLRICRVCVQATHVHLIVVVDNPDDVKGFMERFKTESAHAINRLLGRQKRTVWCEGYDSPVLLTAEDVVEKIAYIDLNGVKDNLVESVREFPGLSNYNIPKSVECPYIRRSTISKLDAKLYTVNEYKACRDNLFKKAKSSHTFTLHPDSWMECFNIQEEEKALWHSKISERIEDREKDFKAKRKWEGKKVLGRQRLISQPLDPSYVPNRSGRRTWCISHDIELRKKFINWIKSMIDRAKEILSRWKQGDFSQAFPLGLYPPAMPKQAELLRPVFSAC